MPIDDRTVSSTGLEDVLQMFIEMEARKVEIPVNGNKYLCVCVRACMHVCVCVRGGGGEFVNINTNYIPGML
jgi:hypothetical protein